MAFLADKKNSAWQSVMEMRILKEKYACSTIAQIPMTISKVITGWENL